MGKRSRDKGLGYERECVNAFLEAGISAERVPLSGAAGGSYTGDVSAAITGRDRLFEAKRRASGFAMLYRWLGTNYGLLLRADRETGLVVLRQSDFLELVKAANKVPAEERNAFFREHEAEMFKGVSA